MQKRTLISILSCLSSIALCEVPPSPTTFQPEGVSTQPNRIITPPVAPRVSHAADIFVTADFIWWKPSHGADQHVYANRGLNNGTSDSSIPVSKGSSEEVTYGFHPGLKVGLGLDFAHDGWDFDGQYTWLSPGSHSETAKPKNYSALTNNVDLFTTPNHLEDVLLSSTSCKARQYFNVLDLMLGRNFFISKYLTLHPSFGVKIGWLEDHFKVLFIPLPDQVASLNTNSIKLTSKNHTFGVGMRAAIDTVWHFCKRWGIYGNVAVSAFWQTSHQSFKEKSDTLSDGSITTANQRSHTQAVSPVIELGLGLTYMTWFYDESYMLELSAGWEAQSWIDVQNNLYLQGLTVKAGFAF